MKNELNENANITANSKQLEILKQNFPNCFDKDGAFQPHKLEELVKASGADITREGYSLNWLGKSYARLLANENIRTLLAANEEHNSKPENANSENLLIQGDNLEVLKHLKNAYREKVKMIYIDPPYNTGSDGFVYSDDRKFTVEQLSQLAGIEEDEAKRILEFTQSKSNSHSAWLTFMFPRLYIARELLRDDGVIFISIDDNEQAQLKLLCDEVFGEENFLGQIANVNNPKGRSDDKYIATAHEFLIAYASSKRTTTLGGFEPDEKIIKRYNKIDNKGEVYREIDLRKTGDEDRRADREDMFYYFYRDDRGKLNVSKTKNKKAFSSEIIPLREDMTEGRWRWGFDTAKSNLNKLHAKEMAKRKIWGIFEKDYLKDRDKVIPTSAWLFKDVNSERGSEEFIELGFTKEVFPRPKPAGTIKRCIELGLSNYKTGVVLDFFSGSGTTAHAIMALNAQDGGNRKCISVQLDEPTDEKSEAYKAGYKSIFEITRERIKRVAAKIKEEHPDATCDFGFKEFKTIEPFGGYLDEADTLEQFTEFEAEKLKTEERNQLMLTWQVHDGLPLHQDLNTVELEGYTAHQGNDLLYFMETGLELKHMVSLLERIDNEKTFAPRKLIIFGQLLSSKAQREISEAINSYNNRKGIELTLDIRF